MAAAARYAELHCRSNFSFLEGASHPEELIERAAELGLEALALTDRDGLYGAVRFAKAAKPLRLPAIVGAELTLDVPEMRPKRRRAPTLEESARFPRLVLLAEDETGYANLARAISTAQLRGRKRDARLRLEDVGDARGLIALSGSHNGYAEEALLRGGDRNRTRTHRTSARLLSRQFLSRTAASPTPRRRAFSPGASRPSRRSQNPLRRHQQRRLCQSNRRQTLRRADLRQIQDLTPARQHAAAAQPRILPEEPRTNATHLHALSQSDQKHARNRRTLHLPPRKTRRPIPQLPHPARRKQHTLLPAHARLQRRARTLRPPAEDRSRTPTRIRTRHHRENGSRRLFLSRLGHLQQSRRTRRPRPRPRLGRQFRSVLRVRHNGRRSHRHETALRTLPLGRAQRSPRYRHRFRPSRSRKSHPIRLRTLRPRTRRDGRRSHHVPNALGDPRCRQSPRPIVSSSRCNLQRIRRPRIASRRNRQQPSRSSRRRSPVTLLSAKATRSRHRKQRPFFADRNHPGSRRGRHGDLRSELRRGAEPRKGGSDERSSGGFPTDGKTASGRAGGRRAARDGGQREKASSLLRLRPTR